MGALDLVEQDELVRRRATLTTELCRPTKTQPAVSTHLSDQTAELGVALAGVAHDLADLGREEAIEVFAEFLAERFLLVRFCQMHNGRDDSPPSDGI